MHQKFSLRNFVKAYILVTAFLLVACDSSNNNQAEINAPSDSDIGNVQQLESIAIVNANRIIKADDEPGNWMSHGRTYDEQRYSPLEQINVDNVGGLGLHWYVDLDTTRGQEATPIVVDGIMFISTAWSKVKAMDARTGKILWEFDPEVPKEWGGIACCDVVNRGVAVWEGKVYVGTLDGRLIALDAVSGDVIWSVVTVDQTKPYTITGAPRIIKDKVIIGNGGAEYGVRGYITAYDVNTGKQQWRFFTVPGDPSQPFEMPILEKAAETWAGEWWQYGGGGTVWDSMTYDAELDLLYIGVGNGSPWNHSIRSNGKGDNLFLSSIVALKPDDGEYVWHYQTTPGDTWDYTATQHIVLADLVINNVDRKVLMQLPKNGFFYVIDRATGELISAEAVVHTNWASHIDLKTGRPVEDPRARYNETGTPWRQTPGPIGAHSWQPMSYSHQTGLVYIPVNETTFVYDKDQEFSKNKKSFNTGIDMSVTALPEGHEQLKEAVGPFQGHLSAWDPVQQKEIWRAQHPSPSNGGILSTAGNLVIQGTATQDFVIYRSDNGEKLWSMPVQTGIVAAPITYTVDQEQYIAILAGWGGVLALVAGNPNFKSGEVGNISRMLVFKLGGEASLPALTEEEPWVLNPPSQTADAETIEQGGRVFARFCAVCHGGGAISGEITPDLRYSPSLGTDLWFEIVQNGLLKDRGMIGFADDLSREDIEAIQAFVVERAHAALATE